MDFLRIGMMTGNTVLNGILKSMYGVMIPLSVIRRILGVLNNRYDNYYIDVLGKAHGTAKGNHVLFCLWGIIKDRYILTLDSAVREPFILPLH